MLIQQRHLEYIQVYPSPATPAYCESDMKRTGFSCGTHGRSETVEDWDRLLHASPDSDDDVHPDDFFRGQQQFPQYGQTGTFQNKYDSTRTSTFF